jgi:hypothetical protein
MHSAHPAGPSPHHEEQAASDEERGHDGFEGVAHRSALSDGNERAASLDRLDPVSIASRTGDQLPAGLPFDLKLSKDGRLVFPLRDGCLSAFVKRLGREALVAVVGKDFGGLHGDAV